MKFNKYLIISLLIIILFYILDTNFKLFINTNYNKYSNILENKILSLHNKLLDSNKIFNDNNIYNVNNNLIFKNKYLNEILLISIFTGILFIYIYHYNKLYLTIDNILIYVILISLGFYLIKIN